MGSWARRFSVPFSANSKRAYYRWKRLVATTEKLAAMREKKIIVLLTTSRGYAVTFRPCGVPLFSSQVL